MMLWFKECIYRFVFMIMAFVFVPNAFAHEMNPALGEISDGTDQDRYTLKIEMSAEAILANVDLSLYGNTEEAPQAQRYDALRALPTLDIAKMIEEQKAKLFSELVVISKGKEYPFQLINFVVPNVDNFELTRPAHFEFQVEKSAQNAQLVWPQRFGDLVLKFKTAHQDGAQYVVGGDRIDLQAAPRSSGQIFMNYIQVGIEHIIPKGLDHILFVLGLFLLSPRWRGLLWQISAFTVAHTVTLALVSTGKLSVPASIVEPLIALSIVAVAVENFYYREFSRQRGVLVFGFGLLHGMGFASVLGQWGLPQSGFLPALLGFNVGVEIGQITVVLAAWLLLAWPFRHTSFYRAYITLPLSAGVGLIGLYWAFERIIGF